MKYSLIETLMGFSVIIVAILFLLFGFSLEKNINSKNISISAIFENVNGLSVGDKVKISGITVGKIRNFELEKDEFEVMVELEVDKNISIPDDSTAKISSSSLFGGKFLEIVPGSSEIFLKNKSVIYDTQTSLSFTDMIGKMIMSSGK
ncbi:MAG: MCE family protein [Alphaproteobacteria bacterium]|nr:MAG: MCE family protein [Alphaproteobacteria bacterium]|tara:strand:+ start:360 stop:803 length:444 start_codon:yes stop_codon:yes gene_type:complete